MDTTLGYVRESLSNYLEKHLAHTIFEKLEKHPNMDAYEFINHLEREEIQYLNDILPKEIDYAEQEKNQKRYDELTSFFERLY
jgi:hypothetical protein